MISARSCRVVLLGAFTILHLGFWPTRGAAQESPPGPGSAVFSIVGQPEEIAGMGWRVTWRTEAGRTYRLLHSTDLDEWTPVHEADATGNVMSHMDTDALGLPMSFWRVQRLGEGDEPDGEVAAATPFAILGNPEEIIGIGWLITWRSEVGRRYRLQRSTDLMGWSPVVGITATGEETSHVDTEALGLPMSFWRVQRLDESSGEPLIVSEIVAGAVLNGATSSALFQIFSSGDEAIDAVLFFDDGVFLGNAQPGSGNSWTFSVPWDANTPEIRSIEAEVIAGDGRTARTEPQRLLLADPSKFVPLDADGAPAYGEFVGVDAGGLLEPFFYYPEGFGEPDAATRAHFAFGAGSSLEPQLAGTSADGMSALSSSSQTIIRFVSATFFRGVGDSEPVAVTGVDNTINLDVMSPGEVAAAFDLASGEVELCWGDRCVVWESGILGDGGWSALQLDLGLGDFELPGGRLNAAVTVDPETGEAYLVVGYFGSWTPIEGTTFSIPEADPLTIYLSRSGQFSAHGTAEATFPNGAALRGTLSWDAPVFAFNFEGREIALPALNQVAQRFSSVNPANGIPVGSGAAELDVARDRLRDLQRGLRGVARGSASQGEGGAAGARPGARPTSAAGSPLKAWAYFLGAETTAALSVDEVDIVRRVIGQAAKTAKSADRLEVALKIYLDLNVIAASGAAELQEAAEAARAQVWAAAMSQVFDSPEFASSLETDRLVRAMVEAGAPVVSSGLGSGEPMMALLDAGDAVETARLAGEYVARRWPPSYFADLQIQSGDFNGTDNPALLQFIDGFRTSNLVRGYEGTRRIITEMAELSAILTQSGIDTSAYPAPETAAQALDALIQRHDMDSFRANNLSAFTRLLDQREDLLTLRRAFFPGAPEPFALSTVQLMDRFQPVFTDAVKNLSPERRVRTYVEVVRALLSFAQSVESEELDGYLRGNWASLAALNGYFGLAASDPRFCSLLAMDLTLAGLAPVKADPPGDFDVSGGYEATGVAIVDGIPQEGLDTLQINQAGLFMKGWLVQRFYSVASNGTLLKVNTGRLRFHGMLLAEGPDARVFAAQLLRENGSLYGTAQFTFMRDGTDVDLAADIYPLAGDPFLRTFLRISDEHPLPEEVFESFGLSALKFAEGIYLQPIHSTEFAVMEQAAADFKQLVHDYWFASGSAARTQIAQAIETAGERASRKLPVFAKTHFTGLVKSRLHQESFQPPGEDERTYWDCLFRIKNDERSKGVEFEVVSQIADLPSTLVAQFLYDLFLVEVGGGASAGAVLSAGLEGGLLYMRVIKKDVNGVHIESFNIAAEFAKISAKFGLSLPVSGGATFALGGFRSSQSYSARDFQGLIVFGDVSGVFGTAGYSPWSSLYFSGIGQFADTSGPSIAIAIPEITAGVNIALGYVHASWDAAKALPTEPEEFSIPDQDITFSSTINSRVDTFLHFKEGLASIEDCGLHYLREFAAEYRALFADPGAIIQIFGFTDPKGHATPEEGPEDNLTLSKNRAEAANQALRSILAVDPSDTFIPSGNIIGLGEAPAIAAGVPDGADAPEWRKVEIILNNRITLRLSAADLSTPQ